jgi:predicted small lipoprotein YifL
VIKRVFLIAVVFAALCALAGCGGGGGGETTAAPVETTEEAALSKQELIAQGDAICAEVNAAVGTMSQSASTNTAARVAQEADLYGGMVERIKGLGPPAEEEGAYSEFLTAAEQLDQAESNARLAAERGEEEALSEAESSAESALSAFQQAAEGYGFEDCSEGPHAPAPASSGEEAGGEEAAEGEVEEAAPEEVEPAPEEGGAPPAEEGAGGGAGVGGEAGGGTETPSGGAGGGSSGGIGPG